MPSNFVKNLGRILLNGRNVRLFFVHNKWYHARKGEEISQNDCSSKATSSISSYQASDGCCSLFRPANSSLPLTDRRAGACGRLWRGRFVIRRAAVDRWSAAPFLRQHQAPVWYWPAPYWLSSASCCEGVRLPTVVIDRAALRITASRGRALSPM